MPGVNAALVPERHTLYVLSLTSQPLVYTQRFVPNSSLVSIRIRCVNPAVVPESLLLGGRTAASLLPFAAVIHTAVLYCCITAAKLLYYYNVLLLYAGSKRGTRPPCCPQLLRGLGFLTVFCRRCQTDGNIFQQSVHKAPLHPSRLVDLAGFCLQYR